MTKKAILSFTAFATLSVGCAHNSPERAMEAAQTGLAVIDVASAELAKSYVDAVQYVRRECRGDAACETRYKVDDASVAKVMAGFKILAEAYDQAAMTARDVQIAWEAIAPLVADVREAKQAIAR